MMLRSKVHRNILKPLAPIALVFCCDLAAATEVQQAAGADAGVASVEAPATVLSPLHREIRTVLEQERAEVVALLARIAEERDGQELLELQRSVEAAKRRAQISVLEVQLRHARVAGKSEAVAALETSLEQLREPELVAQPVERQR